MTAPAPAHRLVAMNGRNPHEPGRTATPLELLFDLTFVVAFGIAGNEAAHLVAEGALAPAAFAYALAILAIVWAWINFSWFASAFDCDDWLYRILTIVQMCGVVVLALGLPAMFASVHHGAMDNRTMVLGYVVMRVAMLAQWLRAYVQQPATRPAVRVYLVTLALAQLGWLVVALAHTSLRVFVVAAVVLFAVEFSGPLVAETRFGGTPWHAHHMAERYGLLVIITLGEGVVGTVAALSGVVGETGWTLDAVLVVIAGMGLTFGMWWVYFGIDHAAALHANRRASFPWGYGHLPLFFGVAGVGMGLHVAGYVLEHKAHISTLVAVATVVVPLVMFVAVLYALFAVVFRTLDRFHVVLLIGTAVPLAAALALAGAGVSMGVCLVVAAALAPVVSIVGYELVGHRHQREFLARLRASDPGHA